MRKPAYILKKTLCSAEKTEKLLLLLGGAGCVLLLLFTALSLAHRPTGSFSAYERRLAGYIESALACYLIGCGGAAVIELVEKEQKL